MLLIQIVLRQRILRSKGSVCELNGSASASDNAAFEFNNSASEMDHFLSKPGNSASLRLSTNLTLGLA